MQIETRWACISTNERVALAASICSLLYKKDSYLPFFEFPKTAHPYSSSRDVNKDGYFSRVVAEQATYWINNALARVQPETILLIGLSAVERGYLEVLFPIEKMREINSIDDFRRIFPDVAVPTDSIECTTAQVVEGLAQAQAQGKFLTVSNSATPLASASRQNGKSLVVIENTSSIEDIAALNYARFVGADVILVPGVDRTEIRDLARELYAWSRDRSHPAFRTLKRRVAKTLGEIDFAKYDNATFFTVGIPYGLAIESKIPTAHVAKQVDCGEFLLDNLVEEIDPLVFDSALIFSPQVFESEETNEIDRILSRDNYVVKRILGHQATVRSLSDYANHYPYDLLHICSHGGETNGYFAVQEFADRQGVKRTVEYYEIVGVSPGRPNMVRMSRKIIFKSFDGHPWGSDAIMALPQYIFDDMLKDIKSNSIAKAKRVRADYPIALSCHIQCSDSIHQGDFTRLAGIGHPVVFNNSCSSSHELAANFIHAGARCYIGTLWSVGNETAQKAARVFYETASEDGNLLKAFFKMSSEIANMRYKNVYIFWGLPSSTYRKPLQKSSLRIQGGLANAYLTISEAEANSTDQFARDNHTDAKNFLWKEMRKNVFRGKRAESTYEEPSSNRRERERATADSQEGFDRGISEIELESEETDHVQPPEQTQERED
jgi:hypothetical protein